MRSDAQRRYWIFCEAVQKGADTMDDTMFLNVLKTTVENHGCTIIDVDLENHIVNLDGPDDAVADCARAISELVS
jgi:hypothetical protein